MAQEFRLPDIGEGLTEAEIVRWLIAEGEYVEADQPLVEVETDKAVVEIPSPYAGIVLRHGAAEGEVVAVGSILVVVGEEDDSAEVETPADRGTEQAPVATAMPIVGSLIEDAEDLSGGRQTATSSHSDQVKALPLVRKLAREAGLDLSSIEGSGPGGRVTREDVLAAADVLPQERSDVGPPGEQGQEPPSSLRDTSPRLASLEGEETAGVPAESVLPPTLTPFAGGRDSADERRHMTRLRRTIAANMSKSWSEIPHVTTFDDVDATRLLEVRRALETRYNTDIPLEALVVKAVLPALMTYPEFNATLDGDDLIIHGSHHIGIAVDTPEGLVVAVIRDADSKGVRELSAEVERLGSGAKVRSLRPDELMGQTFTISNIGAVGGGHGTPIVPLGTTAILSVGQARQKPIVEDGDLVIAPVMPLSLSYDHRVIDGGVGRRFMAQVMENLEEPALFLAT